MKLLSFAQGDRTGVALQRGDGSFMDLAAIGFSTMLDIVAAGPERLHDISQWDADTQEAPLTGNICILAPIPHPVRDVFCVGKNYLRHAKEFGSSGFDSGNTGGDEVPDAPIIFTKATTSVAAPESPICTAFDPDDSVDYEGELAVIIGTGGRNIAKQDAMSHVFGYTVLNDVTAREAQKRHKQWVLGKGIDGFCPMGPVILVANSNLDVTGLRLVTEVNGEIRQDGQISDLIFDIPTLIATISAYITLVPGDIIATGTPEGVGIGFDPPRYLRPGDIVTVSIEPIGSLSNPVT
ncbi:fumarylacetoacetate hydrolase family protein [Parasphingopyxis lamellibrachiae]|uniref:2-keto-4-pentenoate hydratase/2-oxohepta-3-ene-1,7-dioic acid hydratase in catechol pathway n=1 Tax=Parasphingopyxis lamellibrachiae TaxID=680125 RepID=A0A3D9F8Y7_9SPHN|nr:fumarylacetoacetate hydrolase family protein [Parasphingopyxis lamellibrachiae]RED13348.1 2-keto-4-pentenoate hydratase/2-oxohepta-3-ene-1,7-dioic acid hydratase in catechol pathway [Parasphingopyxis lamellibrachiae]